MCTRMVDDQHSAGLNQLRPECLLQVRMFASTSPPTPICRTAASAYALRGPRDTWHLSHAACSNRRPHVLAAASSTPAAVQLAQPPVLPQQEHLETWHGQIRRDEYTWLSNKGPTHPEVLAHLKAESQYTISCLAHTREQQLNLQEKLQAWQQTAAAVSPGPADVLKQQQQQLVWPDWLAGNGHLQYKQHKQYGFPGVTVGNYIFFSLPADSSSSSSLIHCRAAADAAADAAASIGAVQPAVIGSSSSYAPATLPPGALVLWDESGSNRSSSSSSQLLHGGRASTIHSLAVSPCGGYLAVTFKYNTSSTYQLAVLDCSTGDLILQPVPGVDGPVLWVTEPAHTTAAAAATTTTSGQASAVRQLQQQQQCLLYVADDYREVYCLAIGGNTADHVAHAIAANSSNSSDASACVTAVGAAEAAAAAAAGLPVPEASLIYTDPQHVSVSIAATGGHSFITVFGADGLIRQALYHSSVSSSSSSRDVGQDGRLLPTQAEAWQVLLPAAAAAGCLPQQFSASAAIAAAGDDDPTTRLAVTVVGDLLVVRHSSAALPQGQLLLGHWQQQQQQQPMRTGVAVADIMWQLLLPAQIDLNLEAVFVSPDHQSSCSSSGSSTELQLVVLGWKRCPWQQQQQQHTSGDSRSLQAQQQLQVQTYSVMLHDSHHHHHHQQQQQQQQQGQFITNLQLQRTCTLPIPDAFYELQSASWHPQHCELQVEFSSLARPRSRMIVNIPQLALQQQQQQQQQQCESDRGQQQAATDHNATNGGVTAAAAAGVQIKQLAVAPAGFNQSDYATLHFGIPSSNGSVMIPVSLAYNKRLTQLPDSFLTQQQQHPHTTPAAAAAGQRHSEQRLLLTCYGSYGVRENVSFNPELLQLLDAGWFVCIAHVRGGGWCGKDWAEAGRAVNKIQGVQDVLDVVEYIHKVGLVAPDGLSIQGSSAGGWLAASALLQQPQLFAAAVLTVPCLDPLGLLLQHNQGVLELGAAADDAQVYSSIRSWAPYDLLEQRLYPDAQQQQQQQQQQSGVQPSGQLPHVLIRAALNDVEVPISDPIKALARMRHLYNLQSQQQQQQQQQAPSSMQDKLLLLRVVPGGHMAFQGSAKESALKLAFLLSAVRRG